MVRILSAMCSWSGWVNAQQLLVRDRRISHFGLTYLFSSPHTQLEIVLKSLNKKYPVLSHWLLATSRHKSQFRHVMWHMTWHVLWKCQYGWHFWSLLSWLILCLRLSLCFVFFHKLSSCFRSSSFPWVFNSCFIVILSVHLCLLSSLSLSI